MTSAPTRDYLNPDWLEGHLSEERRQADLLSEVREAVFGAQDGVTSILAVVATVAAATAETYAVLVAGLAATLAEVISMAAGEYMSSKSQREVFEAQITGEREEVATRPDEARAEVAYMLEREGLPADAARRIADDLAASPEVLLKTMVEKELGLALEAGGSPLQGALILAAAFFVAAMVPMSPFFFLPTGVALPVAIAFSAVVVFALGIVKSRFTLRNPIVAGLQMVGVVALAAAGGYLFGSLLPTFLGVAGFTP